MEEQAREQPALSVYDEVIFEIADRPSYVLDGPCC